MKMLPKPAIVVVNWNDEETTSRALESLRGANLCDAPIVLVDNASTDRSDERLKKRFQEVELIRLAENRGYTGGCNVGIRWALDRDYDAIFVMNNDVIVSADFLLPLLEACQDEKVGMAGGKILLPGEPRQLQSAGAYINYFIGKTYNRFDGQLDIGQAEEIIEPDFLCGAAFLITKRLLRVIGGFDEEFFMYYEETDLCLRARKAGFRILYIPHSHVWHCEKLFTSSAKISTEKLQYFMLRNSIIFMRRHANPVHKFIFLIYLLFFRLPKEMVKSVLGRGGSVSNVLKAFFGGWRYPVEKVTFNEEK